MAEKRVASDSKVQKEFEAYVLAALSVERGVKLVGSKLKTGHSYIELDAFWEDQGTNSAVVVEVFAHTGKVKAAQRHKVQTDVFKLSLARRILTEQGFTDIKAIVAFVCEDCARSLTGRTWVGDAAGELGVTTLTRPLQNDIKARLLAAQLG